MRGRRFKMGKNKFIPALFSIGFWSFFSNFVPNCPANSFMDNPPKRGISRNPARQRPRYLYTRILYRPGNNTHLSSARKFTSTLSISFDRISTRQASALPHSFAPKYPAECRAFCRDLGTSLPIRRVWRSGKTACTGNEDIHREIY